MMEWLDCPLIEQIPGKMSGAPLIKGSRVRPEDLLINEAEGEAWLAEAFDLPPVTVRLILSFYHEHRSKIAPAI